MPTRSPRYALRGIAAAAVLVVASAGLARLVFPRLLDVRAEAAQALQAERTDVLAQGTYRLPHTLADPERATTVANTVICVNGTAYLQSAALDASGRILALSTVKIHTCDEERRMAERHGREHGR